MEPGMFVGMPIKALFVGVVLIVLGVAAFLVGLQYASFMMPPDVDTLVRERYRFYSSVFGYTSYVLFFGGIFVTVWAIRKQNGLPRTKDWRV